MASNNISAAEYTLGRSVVEGTKKNYRGKLNTMKVFLMSKGYDRCMDTSSEGIVVPLDQEVVEEMFGWISTNTDLPKKRKRFHPEEGEEEDFGYDEEDMAEEEGGEAARISKRNKAHYPSTDISKKRKRSFEDGAKEDSVKRMKSHGPEQQTRLVEDDIEEETSIDIFAQNKVTVSVSCMQGYKSALKWLYKNRKYVFTADMNQWLDQFIQGYKKIVAEKKLNGVMDVKEGKYALSFAGHCFLCYVFLSLRPCGKKYPFKESIFGWCFQTFCWNIIGRCSNVQSLMLQHFNWVEDAMVVKVPQHKGDQTGESLSMDKHVYANPLEPKICTILSLAVFFFCRKRFKRNGQIKCKLFTDDRKDRFGDLLEVILNDKSLVPDNQDLGASKEDLGSHSNRKGAASYLCGLSVNLSAVNIFLRAGWSVGAVQDRYIFSGPGGDQIVGRANAGLDPNSRNFAVLPPHFTKAGEERMRKIGYAQVVEGWDQIPGGFQRVVAKLIASIVYHEKWLRENLGRDHPLFCQLIFTKRIVVGEVVHANAVEALRGYVVCGYDRCPDTMMQATGIPSHILLGNQMSDLRDAVNVQMGELRGKLERMENNFSARMDALEHKLPVDVFKMLMEHFRVDGVAPVNMADMKAMLDERQAEILQRLEQILRENGVQSTQRCCADEVALNSRRSQEASTDYMWWEWGGRLKCMVPSGFTFPKVDVKTMFNLWYFGNSGERIRPYWHLKDFKADLPSPKDCQRYSRCAKVMRWIEGEFNAQNLMEVPANEKTIGLLQPEVAERMFFKAFQQIIGRLYPNGKCPRMAELQCDTLTNRESLLKRKEKSSSSIEVAITEFNNEDSTDIAHEQSYRVQEAQTPAIDTNPRTTPQLLTLEEGVQEVPADIRTPQEGVSNFAYMFGL